MAILAELRESGTTIAAAFTLFTVVGTIYQITQTHAEDSRLVKSLDRFFKWVEDSKFEPFARAEAYHFIILLDRFANDKLWSKQRWAFAARATLACSIVAILWTAISLSVTAARHGIRQNFFNPELDVPFLPGYLAYVVALFVGLALSISATRFVASMVGRMATTKARSILAFGGLLFLHVAFYLYWSAVIFGFVMMVAIYVAEIFYTFTSGRPWSGTIEDFASWAWFYFRDANYWKKDVVTLFGATDSFSRVIFMLGSVTTVSVDLIANGARLAFALVFLMLWVVPDLLHMPLVNAWSWAKKKPDAPLLGVVLGALAGSVAFLVEAGIWLYRGAHCLFQTIATVF